VTSETRIRDLWADRAVQGLTIDEADELGALLEQNNELDTDEFDISAAAIALALTEPDMQPLPEALHVKLERDAVAYFTPYASGASATSIGASRPSPTANRTSPAALAGWLLAAASLLFILLSRPENTVPLDTVARRGRLLVEPQVVRIDWSATEDPVAAGVSGDVVWSDELQEGYMRFENLTVNDPGVNQYQLWIFDADRPAEHPVDGGVFDVTSRETIVPIAAKIPVSQATLFAVTLERPGGVVVSGREHILVTAAVE